jgi:hypothetical protein
MPRSIVFHFPILRNEETRRLDRPPSGGAVPASDSACSTELSAEGEGRMRGRGMRLGTTGDPAGAAEEVVVWFQTVQLAAVSLCSSSVLLSPPAGVLDICMS